MIKREDMGSWLEGPPTHQNYPGENMGRPPKGPGSIARLGPRIIAFVLDWYLVWGLMALIGMAGSRIGDQVALLLLVWIYQILCVGSMGHTVGQLICGMQVQTLAGEPVGWRYALLRATLIMFVIPVVLMDADQRGVHDRACHTVLVRIC